MVGWCRASLGDLDPAASRALHHLFPSAPIETSTSTSKRNSHPCFLLLLLLIRHPTRTMAPSTYIISRVMDPIFAVAIGIGAATMRISREEKEKGRTTNETIEAALR